MILFGDDFNWENAQQNYFQLDSIITEFERRNQNLSTNTSDVFNIKYSTPSEYVKAVKEEVELPTRTGDFFPYSDDVNLFWTGYFSSRPNLKRQVRETLSQAQASSEIFTFRNLEKVSDEARPVQTQDRKLTQKSQKMLREEISILSHHDAITGTSKQLVANDYFERLKKAATQQLDLYTSIISKEIYNSEHNKWAYFNQSQDFWFKEDWQLQILNNQQLIMAVHNPSAIELSKIQVEMPSEAINHQQNHLARVYLEDHGSQSGFSQVDFDIFCNLDFQNFNVQAATKQFISQVNGYWDGEKNSTNYQRWQSVRCYLTIPEAGLRGWDVKTVVVTWGQSSPVMHGRRLKTMDIRS